MLTSEQTDAAPLSVCIVEDQEALRDWMVAMLSSRNMTVRAAVGTIREGEEAITTLRPDLAVIDNKLPDGSGIDLCRSVSGLVPDVVLILHTGLISVEDEREALRAGASAVVLKSLRGIDLLAALDVHGPGRPSAQD